MFSRRAPPDLEPNALTLAAARARVEGRALLDLTVSNPSRAGLAATPDILHALADPRGVTYEPQPFGHADARRVVADSLTTRGAPVDPDRVVLTASTSEAYALLFKILCDAGDEVLVPQPSYPLFDYLTRLEAVLPASYRLDHHGVWSIDRETVQSATSRRTRAVLIVSPNNPTGSMLRTSDAVWLARFCADRGLAVIVDEVFADYPMDPAPDAVHLALSSASPLLAGGDDAPLVFGLGGLSKSVGLPQMKLAWIAAGGRTRLVQDALARLEVACDAYLSVSTPIQLAAPALLDGGRTVHDAIASRLKENHRHLREALRAAPGCSLLRVEGGWSAVVRVPAIVTEESLVLALLEQDGVLVHPGYFFDFAHEAFLVVSLLPEPDVLREALHRVLTRLERL